MPAACDPHGHAGAGHAARRDARAGGRVGRGPQHGAVRVRAAGQRRVRGARPARYPRRRAVIRCCASAPPRQRAGAAGRPGAAGAEPAACLERCARWRGLRTRRAGPARVPAGAVAPAAGPCLARSRTGPVELWRSRRRVGAARGHCRLPARVARRRLRSGPGVHHGRQPGHAGPVRARLCRRRRHRMDRAARLWRRAGRVPCRGPGCGRDSGGRGRHESGRAGLEAAPPQADLHDAVAPVSGGVRAVADAAHGADRRRAPHGGADRRGRLRQRVPARRRTAGGDAGPGAGCAGAVLRHVQQDDVPRPADRLPGRAARAGAADGAAACAVGVDGARGRATGAGRISHQRPVRAAPAPHAPPVP